jgi:hypothetical protein
MADIQREQKSAGGSKTKQQSSRERQDREQSDRQDDVNDRLANTNADDDEDTEPRDDGSQDHPDVEDDEESSAK